MADLSICHDAGLRSLELYGWKGTNACGLSDRLARPGLDLTVSSSNAPLQKVGRLSLTSTHQLIPFQAALYWSAVRLLKQVLPALSWP